MNDQSDTETIPKGDIFIPFKVRNILFFEAEKTMSKLKRWVDEFNTNTHNERQLINSQGPDIIVNVQAILDNTRATAKKSIKPPPINQIRKLETLLAMPFDNLPLKEFCEAWKEYHDLLIDNNIIPNTIDMPTAKDMFYK
jgi:hypothetical protein